VERAERVEPGLVGHQVQERRALAAGQQERVEARELRDATDGTARGARAREGFEVSLEAALQGEDADRAHDALASA
jgi:hypothetical protein